MEFLSEYQQYFDQENDENFLDFSLDFKYKSHKFDWSQENQNQTYGTQNQTYGTQNQGYGMGVKENGQESVKLQNMLILSLKSHITTSDTIPLGLNHHFNNHTTSTNKNQQELLEIHNQSNEQDHYQFDHLVPIKLELDVTDTLKLRDSFLWNLYELYLTPEKFAEILVSEWDLDVYNIPMNSAQYPLLIHQNLINAIAEQIKQQVAAFVMAVEQESASIYDSVVDKGVIRKTSNTGDIKLEIEDRHMLFSSYGIPIPRSQAILAVPPFEDDEEDEEEEDQDENNLDSNGNATSDHQGISSTALQITNTHVDETNEQDVSMDLEPTTSVLAMDASTHLGQTDTTQISAATTDLDVASTLQKMHDSPGKAVEKTVTFDKSINGDDQSAADLSIQVKSEEPSYGDVRIVVKIDVHVSSLYLRDQFEWPLFDHSVTPEEFAKILCADLGLGGEFVSLVSTSIREQVVLARLNFDEATQAPLYSRYLREENARGWEPDVRFLTKGQIAALSKEEERNARRIKRIRQNLGAATVPLNPGSGRRTRNEGGVSGQTSAVTTVPVVPANTNEGGVLASYDGNVVSSLFIEPQVLDPIAVIPAPSQANTNIITTTPALSSEPTKSVIYIDTVPDFSNVSIDPVKKAQQMAMLSDTHDKYIANTKKRGYEKPHTKGGSDAKRQRKTTGKSRYVEDSEDEMDQDGDSEDFDDNDQEEEEEEEVEEEQVVLPQSGLAASTIWRCSWCLVRQEFTPTIRPGPLGPRTVCQECFVSYAKRGLLDRDRFRLNFD